LTWSGKVSLLIVFNCLSAISTSRVENDDWAIFGDVGAEIDCCGTGRDEGLFYSQWK